jgi:hypothetical protein
MSVAEVEEYETDTEQPVIVSQAFTDKVLLLSPTMSVWRGQYQLPNTEVRLNDAVISGSSVTSPRAKLMTNTYPLDSAGKPWKARFDKCASRLVALKNQFSVSFAIAGVRIIPKQAAKEFMRKLFGVTVGTIRRQLETATGDKAAALAQQLNTATLQYGPAITDDMPVYDIAADSDHQSIAFEFWSTVNDFIADFTNIMAQIAHHNECWTAVKARVPTTPAAMRRKFDLGVFPVELAGGDMQSVSLQDLEEHATIVRATCEKQVQAAIESMIAEPRKELAMAIENLEVLIEQQGRVTSRTFDRVRRAIDKLRMFDFVTDAELLSRMTALDTMMSDTIPATLTTGDAASAAFVASIAKVREDVTSEVIMADDFRQFSGLRRALNMDDDF